MLETLTAIVLVGFILPFLGAARGLRTMGWIYLALTPLFMYDKALFAVVRIAGVTVQWPTLAKDMAGLVILVGLVGSELVAGRRQLSSSQRRALLIAAAFILYWLLSSAAMGQGLSQIVLGIRPYAFYTVLGLVLGAYLFHEAGAVTRLATILLVLCVVIGIIALVQRFFIPRFLIHPAMRDVWLGSPIEWQTENERLAAYFTSPNTLGLFMGLGTLTAVWCLAEKAGTWLRPLALAALPILLLVLFLTLSRTALLATACGSILLVFLLDVGRRTRATVLMSAALAFVIVLLTTAYSQRFENLGDNPRLLYWGAYIVGSFSTLTTTFFGHGVGSVGRYGAQVAGGGVVLQELAGQVGTSDIFFVDNFFIRALYETGLLGCLFVVWALWIALKSYFWVYWRAVGSERVRRLSLPAVIMAFVLGVSILTSSLDTYPWNLLFWLCASCFLGVWDRTSRIEVQVARAEPINR